MAILSIHGDNPLKDGRQSARALAVRRGMQRRLIDMRHVTLPELSLRSGRRADIVTLSDGTRRFHLCGRHADMLEIAGNA